MDVTGTKPLAAAGQKAATHVAAWKSKLADGAHQFEAMMIEGMLKPLHFGGAPGSLDTADGGDPDESSDAAADVVRSFGTEALARAIAHGGGFGLATQIIRQVSHEQLAAGHPPQVPGEQTATPSHAQSTRAYNEPASAPSATKVR